MGDLWHFCVFDYSPGSDTTSLPELREISILARRVAFLLGRHLHTPKLSHLRVESASPHVRSNSLSRSQSLRSLEWNVPALNSYVPETLPLVRLPHLTTLKTSTRAFSTTLANVDMPMLASLDLLPDIDATSPSDSVSRDDIGLAISSGRMANLRRLAIRSPRVTLSSYILQNLPLLEELRLLSIGTHKVYEDLLLLGDASSSPTTPCPLLARLAFSVDLPGKTKERRDAACQQLAESLTSFASARTALDGVPLIVEVGGRLRRSTSSCFADLRGSGNVEILFEND